MLTSLFLPVKSIPGKIYLRNRFFLAQQKKQMSHAAAAFSLVDELFSPASKWASDLVSDMSLMLT